MAYLMARTDCRECRHGSLRHQKHKAGVDKRGRPRYNVVTKYYCGFDSITHATTQIACKEYVGWQTMFEYLMGTQPDVVNELLTKMRLRVVGSRNKHGFDIK